jgi:hypothetical protein
MTGLGTIVNVIAILAGCTAGLLLKGGLPKRFQDIVFSAVGLCVTFIGVTGALKGLMSVNGTGFETQDTMIMIACMVVGAILGEWMNIEYRLERLGEWCKSKLPSGNSGSTFVDAFVTSSLMYCVGAMAIVGSLEDGLNHDYTTLFAKSIMDGVIAVVFSAAMGIGTAFSVFPVAIYQGGITLLAGVVKPYLTDLMIGRMSCIGSILIFALGINMILGSKIKIGNMLPAVFLPIILCLLGF